MKSRIIPRTKIICDNCSGEFELKIKESEIEPEIIEQYFECPICGARTTFTITDPEMRSKILQREKIQQWICRIAGDLTKSREVDKFIKKDEELKNELLLASAQMKKKYGRGDMNADDDHA